MSHRFEDWTLVFQGPIGPETRGCLSAARRALPGATIVLSSYAGASTAGLDVDHVVLSEDPGASPFDVLTRQPNNLNRQIVTTRAGLQVVTTPFAVKIRTDIELKSAAFVAAWNAAPSAGSDLPLLSARIVVCSRYTRHPRRSPYVLHPSDWFHAGRVEDVRAIWSAPLVEEPAFSTYNARRFTAWPPGLEGQTYRQTAEQHLWCNLLRERGHDVDLASPWQSTPELVDLTERSFRDNLVILNERDIALRFTKYRTQIWDRLTIMTPRDGRRLHDGLMDDPWKRNGLRALWVTSSLSRSVLRSAELAVPKLRRTSSEVGDPPGEGTAVAAVVLNYGRADLTLECVASLRAQTRPPDEVVVIDNGSGDDSVIVLREALGTSATIVALGDNVGIPGALNVGLRGCLASGAGRVLVLLNDTTLAPDGLELLLARLDARPELAAISPLQVRYDQPDTVITAGGTFRPWAFRAGHRHRALAATSVTGHVPADWLDESGVLFRSAALRSVGLLRGELKFYWDDVEWGVRATRKGWRLECEPRAVLRHRVGSTLGTDVSSSALYWQTRNRVRARRMLDGSVLALLLIPQLVIEQAVRWVARPADRHLAEVRLRVVADVLRRRPYVDL